MSGGGKREEEEEEEVEEAMVQSRDNASREEAASSPLSVHLRLDGELARLEAVAEVAWRGLAGARVGDR